MRSCAVQRSAQAAREEANPFVSLGSGRRHPVSCPRPRRRMPRHPVEPWDPNLGAEVLDVILAEGAHGCDIPSSPPYFFCGSPPSRAANPLVLDARFGEENASPAAPSPTPATVSAFAASSTGGCNKGRARTNPGAANPAAVRIEGFDCRDGGRSSIPSVA